MIFAIDNCFRRLILPSILSVRQALRNVWMWASNENISRNSQILSPFGTIMFAPCLRRLPLPQCASPELLIIVNGHSTTPCHLSPGEMFKVKPTRCYFLNGALLARDVVACFWFSLRSPDNFSFSCFLIPFFYLAVAFSIPPYECLSKF